MVAVGWLVGFSAIAVAESARWSEPGKGERDESGREEREEGRKLGPLNPPQQIEGLPQIQVGPTYQLSVLYIQQTAAAAKPYNSLASL